MNRTRLECHDSEPSDPSVAADALVREEPDDEEDDEENDREEGDDDDEEDEGYSV